MTELRSIEILKGFDPRGFESCTVRTQRVKHPQHREGSVIQLNRAKNEDACTRDHGLSA